MVSDIPFLLIDGPQLGCCFFFSGEIDQPEGMNVIRDEPLMPTCHPLQAAQTLIRSHRIRNLEGRWKQSRIDTIRFQAVHAVKDLLKTKVKLSDELHHISDDEWQQYLTTASELQIEWSVEEQRFVIGVEATGEKEPSP